MASLESSSRILADDEDGFAVAVAVGVGEGDVGGERDVAGHALAEIAELVAGVPDVIAGGVDGVGVGGGVEAWRWRGRGRCRCRIGRRRCRWVCAKVRLGRWKSGGGSDLLVRGGAGVGPGGDFGGSLLRRWCLCEECCGEKKCADEIGCRHDACAASRVVRILDEFKDEEGACRWVGF